MTKPPPRATAPQPPRPPETGRVCAVCGKTRSPSEQKDTYGFHTTLARHGIPGDKAHRECVQGLPPVKP